MKGYLTNYTFNKLCKTLDLKEIPSQEVFVRTVFDNRHVYSILNKMEIKHLFNFAHLLKDEETFIIEYFKHVPERSDSKTMVFDEGGKSKYHLSQDCVFMSKDYKDFHIPQEISSRGDQAVEEYRDWFKSNGFYERFFSGNIRQSTIIYRYNSKYPEKYGVPPLNDNYELIEKIPNSNIKSVEPDFDYNSFESELNHLVELHITNYPNRIAKLLSKMDFLLYKPDSVAQEYLDQYIHPEFYPNYGAEQLKQFWTNSRRIKKDIMDLLFNYFKWKYNFSEKLFNTVNIEKFGLECCKHCQKNSEQNIDNAERIELDDLPF